MTQSIESLPLSNGKAARGYNLDGLLTAAAPLDEFLIYRLKPSPAASTTISYDLRNPFPLQLQELWILRQTASAAITNFIVNGEMVIESQDVSTSGSNRWFRVPLGVFIFPPETTIQIFHTVANARTYALYLKRIAAEFIDL